MIKYRVILPNGFTEFSNRADAEQHCIDLQIPINVVEVTETPPPVDMVAYVSSKIESAKIFGARLVTEYGAQNTLRQLSVTQVQQIMAATLMLKGALDSGSLYVALDELSKIQVDGVLIRQSDIDQFRNKIQDYLGIART